MMLQKQSDNIYSYFKTTTEPFDNLDWDGEILEIILNDVVIESYTIKDLKELNIEI